MNEEYAEIRELAKRYCELAVSPKQMKRRELWRQHNNFHFTKPPVYVRMVPFCEFYDESKIRTGDPLLRPYALRFAKVLDYQQYLDDDFIYEPWVTLQACLQSGSIWGISYGLNGRKHGYISGKGGFRQSVTTLLEGGQKTAYAFEPCIRTLEDADQIKPLPYKIDEEATKANFDKLYDAIGDIMPIHVDRRAALCTEHHTGSICIMMGMEQMMWNIYDNPELIHKVMGIMSKAVIADIKATEAAGNFSTADYYNQSIPYCATMPDPDPGKKGVAADQLWIYSHAQDTTCISPAAFAEFFLPYQKPILEMFGMTSYGCCEDLTNRIDLLRTVRNLRRIAVTPWADVKKCAERIGRDFVISYRPNPSCLAMGLDEDYVRRTLRADFEVFKANNSVFDVTMKDNENCAGKPENLIRWVQIVREEGEKVFG